MMSQLENHKKINKKFLKVNKYLTKIKAALSFYFINYEKDI